ncbi:hypothetical protein F7U72_19190 [Vibrio vulnificus]|nr:hypothetical protein [Vibrio vulnificus]
MVSASFSHFKSPLGRRFDLIIRARRLECGVYDSLTINLSLFTLAMFVQNSANYVRRLFD